MRAIGYLGLVRTTRFPVSPCSPAPLVNHSVVFSREVPPRCVPQSLAVEVGGPRGARLLLQCRLVAGLKLDESREVPSTMGLMELGVQDTSTPAARTRSFGRQACGHYEILASLLVLLTA